MAVRRQMQLELCAVTVEPRRQRVEAQPGAALPGIEPGIGEQHRAGADLRRVQMAAPRPAVAAHLKQIGEIGVEAEGERERLRPGGEVAHRNALEAGAVIEEFRAPEMDEVVLQRGVTAEFQVGIGEVTDQRRIVVAQDRGQQQRARALQAEREAGEVARVAVIEPLRAAHFRGQVAIGVEHREGVVVLQRAGAPLLQRGGRGNGKLAARLDRHFRQIHRERPLGWPGT